MAAEIITVNQGDFRLSTDPDLIDVTKVHAYLSEHAYWASSRSLETVQTSITNSGLVAGAYDIEGKLVAFARMVTDLATFAWLCDVFVVEDHQGNGLGIAIVDLLVGHPSLSGLKQQILATRDAHTLYARFGYEPLAEPEKWMVRRTDPQS